MTGPGPRGGEGEVRDIHDVLSVQLTPVNNRPFPRVFLYGPGILLRFSSLYPDESTEQAIDRFHRASLHFNKLREFGIESVETDTDNYGLVAQGDHPTDPGEGEGIYYTVPDVELWPLQEDTLSLEGELFHPLLDYFEWAAGSQNEVLGELIVPNLEMKSQLTQFSRLADGRLILHDIEPEMFSLETAGGLMSFWRVLDCISNRCETLGYSQAIKDRTKRLADGIYAKLEALSSSPE